MRSAATPAASLLGALVLAVVPAGQAQPTPSLWASWQAPPECPQEGEFVAQAEGFLGHALNARNDRQLEIVGSVRADEARGFVAKLRVRTSRETQQRELAHRNCGELTEAAALIAALAIEPELIVPPKPEPEPKPPAVTPLPTDEAVPAAAEPASPEPAPAPSHSSAVLAATDRAHEPPAPAPLHASISALGLFGSSVLPGAGAGLGIQSTIGPGRFRLAAQGSYWLSRFQPLQGTDGPGLEVGTWGVALKACALPLTGEVAVALCLGPAVGDMYGAGSGAKLLNARTVHDHWSALELEASLSLSSRAGVTTLLGLQLGRTLEAPRFSITVAGREVPVFEANAWVVNGFVGLGVFR